MTPNKRISYIKSELNPVTNIVETLNISVEGETLLECITTLDYLKKGDKFENRNETTKKKQFKGNRSRKL